MPSSHPLLRRIGVALWGIPLILIVIYFGGWVFALFIAFMAALALLEFYTLSERISFNPQSVPAILLALGAVFAAAFLNLILWFGLMFFLAVILAWLEMVFGEKEAYRDLPLTIFGWIYIPFFLGMMVFIRSAIWNDGKSSSLYIIYMLSSIWICDTAAYAGGRAFGRHKLFPRVSPKKTWEGFFAGIIGALAWVWVVFPFLQEKTDFHDLLFVALVVGIFGQFGDLLESYFKRNAGVKDSGNLLPEHGGIFDRFDSLILTTPFVFFYQLAMGRITLF